MAFIIDVASVHKKITLKRPGLEEEYFTVEIRVHPRDKQKEIQKKIDDKEISNEEQIFSDLLSLGDLQNSKNETVESTPELLHKTYQDAFAGPKIMQAWYQVQNGLPEETAKN